MDGAHGLPRDATSPARELQQVIHDIGKQRIGNRIKQNFTQRYYYRVIERVDKEERKSEGQIRKYNRGMIKVPGLSHKMANQRNLSLAWFMFQKIYIMYLDKNNKEERNSAMLLSSISEHEQAKKVNKNIEVSRYKDENNQPFLKI